jgi:environmental stress-induced protein Ves
VQIINPNEFKRLPWKNGKGETIELAINEGGSLADFDWRISMASVTEDGPFSDFSGYQRHLLLLKGIGIELTHLDGASINNTISNSINNGENNVGHQERHDLHTLDTQTLHAQRLETQILDTPLRIASFDGALATSGRLIAGPIRDFNLIVKADKYYSQVSCLIASPAQASVNISSNTSTKSLTLASNQLLFFYAVKSDCKFNIGNQTTTLPKGHLLKLIGAETGNSVDISLTGEQVIIMSLSIKSPQY